MDIDALLLSSDEECLKRVTDFYQNAYKEDPEAVMSVLKRKGLNDEKLISLFRVGMAKRQLGLLLPVKQLKAGKDIREKLQRIGIYRSSGHEHLSGSLTVPVCDQHNTVVDLYGHKIITNLRPGTEYELCLNNDPVRLWNAPVIVDADEIVLCSSVFDAMTFWVNGYRNVVSLYLRSTLSEAEINLFKRYKVSRFLVSPDLDQVLSQLQHAGFSCFQMTLPAGQSVNQYSLSIANKREALGRLIRHAAWVETPIRSLDAESLLDMDDEEDGETNDYEDDMNVDAESALALLGEIEADNEESVLESLSLSDVDVIGETDSDSVDENMLLPSVRVPESSLDIPVTVTDQEVTLSLGDRHYRIRGLYKNSNYDRMKVNLLVSKNERFHVDLFDLYISRQRATFINHASLELAEHEDTIKQDLGKLLLQLEVLLDEHLKKDLGGSHTVEPEVEMTDDEKRDALEFLKSADLLERLLADYHKAGVVGEESNKTIGFIAAVSRLLDDPLAIIIQSTSAAGKSTLMESILSFIPAEEKIAFSAMTGQSLYYMGHQDIKHKILAIAEEEGISQASYALKLLQSEGELSIASTGKDAQGQLVTETYNVEGPVMLFLTTTAIDIDEELLNRCLVLTVNESREQTEAIHSIQRQSQTLEGMLRKQGKKAVMHLHQNAQRLLKPYKVVNPYAEQLSFLSDKTRTRRDHMKYLTLIRAIALLHQYQRKVHTVTHQQDTLEYIEVNPEDIRIANKLAHDVLGRSLDELPPQTRNLLQRVNDYVVQSCDQRQIARSSFRFTRKDIRCYSGWGQTQLRIHLKRLVDMEYLLVHRGGRGQAFEYELLWDGQGQDGQPFFSGLLTEVGGVA